MRAVTPRPNSLCRWSNAMTAGRVPSVGQTICCRSGDSPSAEVAIALSMRPRPSAVDLGDRPVRRPATRHWRSLALYPAASASAGVEKHSSAPVRE